MGTARQIEQSSVVSRFWSRANLTDLVSFIALVLMGLGLATVAGCDDENTNNTPIEGLAKLFPCTEQGIREAVAEGGGPYGFSCGGPITVVTDAEIVIDNDVMLDGRGELRVNADFNHRLFSVPEGVTAELRGFEITRGGSDGAILNFGALTLTNSTVSETRGVGILSGLDDPDQIDGVQGSPSDATLTVTKSTVARNSGAGILALGPLTVTNSTVSETSAGSTMWSWGNGDGIVFGDDLVLASSTLSRNFGAAINSGVGLGSLTVSKSLIEGTCSVHGGSDAESAGYNIESPGDTCPFGHPTDQVRVRPLDLHLGPLQDNGGPTHTHTIEEASVAFDRIPKEMCEVDTDQRSFARPSGEGCDVGAFELEIESTRDTCQFESLGMGGARRPCPCDKVCNLDTSVCEDGINAPAEEFCIRPGGDLFSGGPDDYGICDGDGHCVECFADEHCGDDRNDCTAELCDSAFGECATIALENGTPCAGGTCDASRCALSGAVLPCTEQGIQNALFAGGGPYTFDCEGPTVVSTKGFEIRKDVILDGGGNLIVAGDGGANVFEVGCVFNDPPVGNEACGGAGEAELHGLTITGGGSGIDMDNEDVRFTLTGCTVSGNDGEGISNSGTMVVTNCTVSGNAGPGIDGGSVTLTHTTLSGNEGGAITGGDVTIANSLIEGSCTDVEITSAGYNVESPANTCGLDQEGDQVDVAAAQLNLGPLADNGGGTQTHALLPGSVALDAVPVASCLDPDGEPLATDQRGVSRPQGGACDVGAFEREP